MGGTEKQRTAVEPAAYDGKRVAFLTHKFPLPSQTFVIDQICGLLDRGYKVRVFTWHVAPPSERAAISAKVGRYSLLEKTVRLGLSAHQADATRLNRLRRRGQQVWRFGLAALYGTGDVFRGRTTGRELWGELSAWHRGVPLADYRRLISLPFRQSAVWVCNFGPNGAQAVALRKKGLIKAPILTIFHGFDLTPRHLGTSKEGVTEAGRTAYADLFQYGSRFLAISQRWRDKLAEMDCPADKLYLWHLGVDIDHLPMRDPKPLQAGDRIEILTIARLTEKKGVHHLLDAVALLPAEDRTRINLRIIGEGPMADQLKAQVADLELLSQVSFEGAQSHQAVLAAVRKADAMVLPSITAADGDQEGIPVSLMEAMALGVPVISTYHSAIPELIRDRETGFLVPEGDPDALAQVLRRFLKDGPSTEMINRARGTVEGSFNHAVQIDLLADHVDRLGRDGGVS